MSVEEPLGVSHPRVRQRRNEDAAWSYPTPKDTADTIRSSIAF
ncbi:MAG: DUF427 domain-containing protein [Acidobacteriota bacterium]|nr:DUF427 domain-containing protein [Acidobacteriota bacterium]